MLDLIKVFFGIFVVMDSLGNLPVFLIFMKGLKNNKRYEMVKKTVIVAAIILFAFLFLGSSILDFFSIDMMSFKVAGGLILLIYGLKLVLGLKIAEKRAESYKLAVVPLATPLITGPGTITTIMIYSSTYGFLTTFLGSVINIILVYIILLNVEKIHKFLGVQGSDALSRIMGLILTAIAVTFIRQGLVLNPIL